MLKSRPSALRRFYRKARRLYKMVLYGRPSGMISIREFDGNIGSWHRVRIAEGLRNPRPKTLGKAPMDFTSMLDPIPELGVISLRHGNVFGSQGWVFTEDKRFVYDISWYGLHAHLGLLPSEFPKPQRIDGRCLVLASDWGNVNYAHFILDCLPRLYLYQEAGYSIADVDYICIPEPPSRSARRTMIALGIPEDKCVWSNDNALLQFDEIIATSFPGSRRNYAQWVPRYLQTILKPVGVLGAPVARKIYVPRSGERKIINEEQLLNIARNYDIEPHDFSNIDNQPEIFNECELVIGPHGAGLTNIAFCKRNTKVLELIPSDHRFPYYYTIAQAGELDYYCLVGNSLGKRPDDSFGPSPYDFCVAPDEFETSLQQMVT